MTKERFKMRRLWICLITGCSLTAALPAQARTSRAGSGPAQPSGSRSESDSELGEQILAAEALAQTAFAAYLAENFDRAVELYEQAYALISSPDILFNIARIEERHRANPQRALLHYGRVARAPDADPERAAEAERRTRALVAQLTKSTPRVSEPPMAASDVMAVTLDSHTVAPSAAERLDTTASPWTSLDTVALSLSGLAAVGVSAGVGLALAGRDREVQCSGTTCSSSRQERISHAVDNLRQGSRASFALGGAAAMGALTVYLFRAFEGRSPSNAQSLASNWSMRPAFGFRAVGASISSNW